MHFWINKSQGCGFNGRYVPPSISAGTRRNQIPKPMVTPVHRFQSIESVASGGHHHHHHHHHHRHPRAPSYHSSRFPVPTSQQHAHNNHSASGQHHNQRNNQRRVSIDYVSNGHRGTLTPVNGASGNGVREGVSSATAKLKCGVWAIISLVPFMIVAAKYYLNGENIGAEVLVFFIMLVLILLVIGFVSLFEAFGQKRHSRSPSVQISTELNDTFEESSHQPSHTQHHLQTGSPAGVHHTPIHGELPPPPYHIAVMLPTQNDRMTIIQDSPPPTYEKAVN